MNTAESNAHTIKVLRELVEPLLKGKASHSEMYVILTGIITGTLIFLEEKNYRMAASMFEEGVVPNVLERISMVQKLLQKE